MSNFKEIIIKGARVNNLQNIDIKLPLNEIICFSGPSGSGKTSLAFHTLYTESKRRFLNSFPNYLKFFSDRPAPVEVDKIFPVLPVFALPQINPIVGSRSTAADIMQLTEHLQTLYFNFSEPRCEKHGLALQNITLSEEIEKIVSKEKEENFHIFIEKNQFIADFRKLPFPTRTKKNIESEISVFNESDLFWELLRFKKQKAVILEKRILELNIYNRNITLYLCSKEKLVKKISLPFSKKCPKCNYSVDKKPTISEFSPYNAAGACETCKGYGATLEYDNKKLFIEDLSIQEGGIKFLEYSKFKDFIVPLKRILKKEKISLSVPIKKLPKKFEKIAFEGKDDFPGFNALFNYLESKRYKPQIRIFIRRIQKEVICGDCNGSRLSLRVKNQFLIGELEGIPFPNIVKLTIEELNKYLEKYLESNKKSLEKKKKDILGNIIKLLKIAMSIGLSHLRLDRKAKTLTPGEYQRLLLVKYLSYIGTEALFIFDEPSLGLSLDEQKMLLKSFIKLKEQGNTIIVIDHSLYFQKNCNYLVLMGPHSGSRGGKVVFQGRYVNSPINKAKKVKIIKTIKPKKRSYIIADDVAIHNHEYKKIKLAENELNWIYGQAGCGKTSVIVKAITNQIHYKLKNDYISDDKYSIRKLENKKFDDVIVIASNLNKTTRRSTIGSITELNTIIRKRFTQIPMSKSLGLKEGHFSSNSKLGQCPKCEGRGNLTIEMQFLEDVLLLCEDCNGKKIKETYATISDGKNNIVESYNIPIKELFVDYKLTPKFKRILKYLEILNLDYLTLGRSISSLSGGEKQRIFLLSKLLRNMKNSLIVIENISFGLSSEDLIKTGELLKNLVNIGNTLLIIDQNPIIGELSTYQLDFSTVHKNRI